MKLKLGLLVGMAMLAGCASTPKPEMPDDRYASYAAAWTSTEICGAQGDMDPVLVAYGKTRLGYDMNNYSFDTNRMNLAIQVQAGSIKSVPKEQCNKLASVYAGLRDEYDRNSKSGSSNQTNQASCYTTPYGNVTNCVTY